MFKHYKQQISDYLTVFLNQKSPELELINPWGKDLVHRLLPFLQNGKIIRGSLVLFSQNMFSSFDKNGIIAAAALEIAHAGILIHDDVFDEDNLRRGQPAIHTQFANFGKLNNVNFGKSLGTCAGDICYFLSQGLLAKLDLDSKTKQNILNTFSQEMQCVLLAQMQDIYFGQINTSPQEKEILDLYRTKTGRYSFSLPLILGVILANQDQNVINNLEQLGEKLGLLYQIKDDELNLFGTVKTGKPVGRDISRANKTLYYHYLFSLSSSNEQKLLKNIFGKSVVTQDEIMYVKNLVLSLSIDKKIAMTTQNIEKEVVNMISKLPIKQNDKQTLFDLLNFIQERDV